jgi:drug/metabolite transporter (DMT)-like permease
VLESQACRAQAAFIFECDVNMSDDLARAAAVRRATLVGLVAVVCWSCTVGLMRSVAEALGALGGAAMLYSVSAVLLLLIKGVPTRAQLRSASKVYLLVCGTLFALYEICLSVAIGLAHDRTQSMELGMINYLWPCLTIVLAVVCRQQVARWWLWPGVALCIGGLLLVMGDGSNATAGPWWQSMGAHMAANPLAYTLAFGAAVMWPAYTVLSRIYGDGFNGVGLFFLLTALLLWGKWLTLDVPPMQWSWSVAAQVLAVGASTAVGYHCWEHGIQRGNLAVLAAGSYFTPVLSALLASVWLAVQPGWPFWQGVVLITVGSLVCWWATRKH